MKIDFKSLFTEKSIITIGLALICLGLIIRVFVRDPQYYRDLKQDRKELLARQDSLSQRLNKLDIQLGDLETGQAMFYGVIAQNNNLIQKYNQELKSIRNSFNEKIKNIDRYTISDLDSFFRTRYREYYTK